MIQAAEDAQENPTIYAQIERWAILRLREPDQKPTLHITGHIVMHTRFVADVGAPYVGTRLSMLDLDSRIGVNHRGRTIALLGDPLPRGRLPDDILRALRRTCERWELPRDASWERLEPEGAQPISLAKPEARIEHWDLILSYNRWYLIGFVFGHRRLPDGRLALTSEAIEAYIAKGATWVETLNTVYRLGAVAPDDRSAEYQELIDERLGVSALNADRRNSK